jgi:hypothetical protein
VNAFGGDALLVGSGALGSLAVALVDLVAALYLLKVRFASPRDGARDPYAALPLSLFFFALSAMGFSQAAMMSVLDVPTSFFLNYGVQSVAVVLSAPPIVAFAYGFLGDLHPRERRVAVASVSFACVVSKS